MVVDIFDFARHGKQVSADTALASFTRLLEGQADQDPSALVKWSVRGSVNGQDQMFLHVQATAEPWLVCQRCLGPVAWPVHVDVRVQLVATEDELDTDDTDDQPEKIQGSTRFNVLSLIEDELILDLPYVPRHENESCPVRHESLDAPADTSSGQKPSPFAVLGQLRKNPD